MVERLSLNNFHEETVTLFLGRTLTNKVFRMYCKRILKGGVCCLIVFSLLYLLIISLGNKHRRTSGDQEQILNTKHFKSRKQKKITSPTNLPLLSYNPRSKNISYGKYVLDTLNKSRRVHNSPLKKASNIFFLKVPKTGSTGMYSIFSRFALKYNLRVATYRDRPLTVSKNGTLLTYLTPPFFGSKKIKYNMITEHSRYDPVTINKVLQHPVKFIAFLRNPVTWSEAFLVHHDHKEPLKLDPKRIIGSFIEKLSNKTWYNIHKSGLDIHRDFIPILFTSYNNKLHDERWLREIDKDFFIGITEYYDESLILMKRYLGWSFEDILYIQLRKNNYKHTIVRDELYRGLCQWMQTTCVIYEYFKERLLQRIHKEGQSLSLEVEHFRKTLKKITNFCGVAYGLIRSGKKINTSTKVEFPRSTWHKPFSYTYIDCALSRFREFTYRAVFYYKQNPYFGAPCPLMYRKVYICNKVEALANDPDMITKIINDPRMYLWDV